MITSKLDNEMFEGNVKTMFKIKRTGIIFTVIIGCIITVFVATKSLANTIKIDQSNKITLPEKQTNHSYPTSLTIKEKMLNATDHYHTVQGSYLHKTPTRDVISEFIVEVGENPYSHVKIIDNKSGEIKKDSISNSHAQDATIITYPQQIAAWLNDETKNYQIISNESYLNRDSTIIEGKLDALLSQKFNGNLFKIWVDAETGVLFKLITVNEKNEETSKLEVLKIDFNKDIRQK